MKKKRTCWPGVGLLSLLLLVIPAAAEGAVDQPTATVQALVGDVLGTTPARGTFPAEIGLALQSGDIIETLVSSRATLALSEGSELQLAESTKLDLEQLIQDQVTSARRSRVKLMAGKMRATLSAGHQDEGASFNIETPNTLVAVKFSRPIIEVSYDPATDTTIVDALTVEVVVTNLRTLRELIVPVGRRVIITGSDMNELAIDRQNPVFPAPSVDSTESLQQTHSNITQATSSTVPGSVGSGGGGGAETSSNPSPGARPARPDRQRRIVIMHIREE